MFLPSHKYVLPLGQLRNMKMPLPCLLLKGPESRELGPVLQVDFICRSPVLMLGEECVFGANDFSFEVSCECRMVLRQSCYERVNNSLFRSGTLHKYTPLIRRYPHRKDSLMSTCLISTWTSYCWRSDCWVPMNLLPARR